MKLETKLLPLLARVAMVAAAPLVFAADPPPAPPDVAAPPDDAQVEESGLASKKLADGTGDTHPTANDTVVVNYTGWTTDGKMFDSSIQRGQPARFPLNQVIDGWTEGLQLMVEGEKRRFWIPEELAYQGRQGAPAGMLVFDVELLEIAAAPKTPEDLTAPEDAVVSATGLASKVLEKGTGSEKPSSEDTVKVHYSAWTSDGKMFDSSVQRGQPASFPLGQGQLKGLAEGVKMMVVGEKRRLWIPEKLAFAGRQGAPKGDLVFDVELLDIVRPPAAPPDVAAAPDDADCDSSGLCWKVLTAGTGSDKPKASSQVTVHYTGWTTDGKMFDSSVVRGQPATFGLNQVIKGWTDGLQKMVVGEKRRFWIPEKLAYQGRPGAPAGMLVFDVELFEIQ